MINKLTTIGMTLIAISVSLSLIGSVHALDMQHYMDATKKSGSYAASITSIMYACVDVTKAQDTPTMEKCNAFIDGLNVAIGQVFNTSKADMDEIMRKAIDSKVTGGFDSSVPQYNYGPQEYRQ